jgi:hypothetical protein
LVAHFAEATHALNVQTRQIQQQGSTHLLHEELQTTANNTDVSSEITSPPQKMPKLFANYNRLNAAETTDGRSEISVWDTLNSYLNMSINGNETDILTFWTQHKAQYNKLIPAVLRILSVPASSAPVERVFSFGGIFLRPNRARMSDKLLSTLVFLKCNEEL